MLRECEGARRLESIVDVLVKAMECVYMDSIMASRGRETGTREKESHVRRCQGFVVAKLGEGGNSAYSAGSSGSTAPVPPL